MPAYESNYGLWLSHTFVALALGKAFQHPISAWSVLLSRAVGSIVPDLDVGSYFGIRYGGLWGHCGMTHSLLFACLLSAAFVPM